MLQPGDQLPDRERGGRQLAINPNTVLKAYRELDHEGLVEGRRGQGTFVSRTLTPTPPSDYCALQAAPALDRAGTRGGLDEDDIAALVAATVQAAFVSEEAA